MKIIKNIVKCMTISIKELNTKWWWRLVKVLYLLFFSIVAVITVVACIVYFFYDEENDISQSSIYCKNINKTISLNDQPNLVESYGSPNHEEIVSACDSLVIFPESIEGESIRQFQLRLHDAGWIPLNTPSYDSDEFYSVNLEYKLNFIAILYLLISLAIELLLFELFRRSFFYILTGQFLRIK